MTSHLGALECPTLGQEVPHPGDPSAPGQVLLRGQSCSASARLPFGAAHSWLRTVRALAGVCACARPLPTRCQCHARAVTTEHASRRFQMLP